MTPDDSLREFPCALCGDDQPRPRFVKQGFRYVRCGDCGFQYVSPRHAEATEANLAFSEARDDYVEGGEGGSHRTEKYVARLRRFEAHRRTGRFLEVGCREGHLLAVARDELGWETRGVEPEAAPARVATERFGLEVHSGYVEDAGLAEKSFDVVYLNEVIEHIAAPLPVFREIARVLRPGGVVYVKTGSCSSLTARWFGKAWSYYAYHRIGHVSYYSPALLARLFTTVGLEPIETNTWGFEIPGRSSASRWARRLGVSLLVKTLGLGTHVETLGRRPEPSAVEGTVPSSV